MACALLLRDSATAASSKRRESCRAYPVISVTLVLHLHVTGQQSIFVMARCDFSARQKVETHAAKFIETSLKELRLRARELLGFLGSAACIRGAAGGPTPVGRYS
jgi:hypothetical protein